MPRGPVYLCWFLEQLSADYEENDDHVTANAQDLSAARVLASCHIGPVPELIRLAASWTRYFTSPRGTGMSVTLSRPDDYGSMMVGVRIDYVDAQRAKYAPNSESGWIATSSSPIIGFELALSALYRAEKRGQLFFPEVAAKDIVYGV